MKIVTVALITLIAIVQADLWFGQGGVPRNVQLQSQIDRQQVANESARALNARLSAEIRDLREGTEMVEERARHDLGMVKTDEIFVQIAPRR